MLGWETLLRPCAIARQVEIFPRVACLAYEAFRSRGRSVYFLVSPPPLWPSFRPPSHPLRAFRSDVAHYPLYRSKLWHSSNAIFCLACESESPTVLERGIYWRKENERKGKNVKEKNDNLYHQPAFCWRDVRLRLAPVYRELECEAIARSSRRGRRYKRSDTYAQ